jgi:hypothetical protein
MYLLLGDSLEERSLSSILRSKLLTTLINNDVSGKLNAGGRVSTVDKFQAIADVFASGSAEIKLLVSGTT